MTDYRPRPGRVPARLPRWASSVPEYSTPTEWMRHVLMPHWLDAGASIGVRYFLTSLFLAQPYGPTSLPLSRIAAQMGSDKRSVTKWQREAVALGLLVVTKEDDDGTPRTVRTLVAPANAGADLPGCPWRVR